MLSRQFQLACNLPDHPCYELTLSEDNPRKIRKTSSCFKHEIKDLVTPNITADDYKKGLEQLHKTAVADCLANYLPNPVLNGPPPPISSEEKHLPRESRRILAQLRSGHSHILMSYRSTIDNSASDICPDCRIHEHTVEHLFKCTAKPTTLTPVALWRRPVEASIFLGLSTTI